MFQTIFNLIFAALFIAATLFPFWLVYVLWPKHGRATRFRLVVPLVLLILVLLWNWAMFYAFQIECGRGISIERLGVLTKRPEGAELRGYRHWLHESFNWGRPLHQGAVEFFDVQVGMGTQRYCRVGKASEISRRCDLLKAISPSVVINVKAPYPLYWWAPSLQIMEYEVFEKSTNRPLVYASDILFGAGLAGMYLRFWKGDQDFDRLSCRYASTDIGPWRPSLSGRPRVAQYETADLQLLLAAFP